MKQALRAILTTVLVVATLGAIYLLFLLRSLLFVTFAALVLASALRPLIGWVQARLHLSYRLSVVAVYLGLIATLFGGMAAIVPAIAGDAANLFGRSGDLYAGWHRLAMDLRALAQARLNLVLPLPPSEEQFHAWIVEAAASFQRALPSYALRTGEALADLLFGLVLSYYWLEARDHLLGCLLRLLPPARRPHLQAAVDDVERVLGGYLGGQLLLSVLLGLVSLPVLVLLRLPHPAGLAFVLAVCHLVPLIGSFVGFAVPILVALALSPGRGLIAFAVLMVIHQLENNLLAPRLLQRQVGLSPLLVLLALAAGALLGGVMGAIVGVPMAGVLWIIARHALGVVPEAVAVGPVAPRRDVL